MELPRPSAARFLPILVTLLLSLAGCSHALGPEVMPTTSIQGRIHLSGKAIGQGWLEIVPVDGTLGRLRSTTIHADGSFSAEKVPVGRIAIRLAGPPATKTGNTRLDKFLFMCRRMPIIRKTVANQANVRLEIELRDEMAEFERSYPTSL